MCVCVCLCVCVCVQACVCVCTHVGAPTYMEYFCSQVAQRISHNKVDRLDAHAHALTQMHSHTYTSHFGLKRPHPHTHPHPSSRDTRGLRSKLWQCAGWTAEQLDKHSQTYTHHILDFPIPTTFPQTNKHTHTHTHTWSLDTDGLRSRCWLMAVRRLDS